MVATNLFNRLQHQLLNTSSDDNFLTQRDDKDNSEVPPIIPLSRSEDESSPKANSDEDKPPTPLKKKGPVDRAARDCRIGFKELGEKGGKNIKEGLTVAGEKVKDGMKETGEKVKEGMKEAGQNVKEGMKEVGEKVKDGMKEAGEKVGDKVKEGLKDMSLTIKISPGLKLIVLIINFTWLGAFLLWLYH